MKKFVSLLVLTLLLIPSLMSVAEAKSKKRSWSSSYHRRTYYRTYPRRSVRRTYYRPARRTWRSNNGWQRGRGRKYGHYKRYYRERRR